MQQREYLTPSGLKFILREQTGADDDILSASDQDESKVINRYLSNLIVSGPEGKPLSTEDVKQLRLRDKYFLVIASRILSLGEIMYFTYQWPDSSKMEYGINLSDYLWDYTKPFPEPDSPEFFDQALPPYCSEENLYKALASGREIRFEFITGVGEEYLLKLPINQRTINKQLLARNLQSVENDGWKKVINFSPFTSREMAEIRGMVDEFDPQFDGLFTIDHPITNQPLQLPLLGIKDFFFPVKV